MNKLKAKLQSEKQGYYNSCDSIEKDIYSDYCILLGNIKQALESIDRPDQQTSQQINKDINKLAKLKDQLVYFFDLYSRKKNNIKNNLLMADLVEILESRLTEENNK